MMIKELNSVDTYMDNLVELLVLTVEEGASIGFLPPMLETEAKEYWESVLKPEVNLYVAMMNDKIVGSIQLHLCPKPNGKHRAEIAKLMTHPHFRRKGIARLLMEKAEERAKNEGCSLVVLDTREGDESNFLYASLGYYEAGKIPYYAMSANGELHSTVFYYKALF
ncbi:GNAT family N-acetyltransferase [Neobacillus sp. D3-1R]|uniref:GNAT family N-acetyltransferase n=1 Tax=Neobacillus sp. D3-1R TaxID=3445778 RepID=UPI003F9EFDF6